MKVDSSVVPATTEFKEVSNKASIKVNGRTISPGTSDIKLNHGATNASQGGTLQAKKVTIAPPPPPPPPVTIEPTGAKSSKPVMSLADALSQGTVNLRHVEANTSGGAKNNLNNELMNAIVSRRAAADATALVSQGTKQEEEPLPSVASKKIVVVPQIEIKYDERGIPLPPPPPPPAVMKAKPVIVAQKPALSSNKSTSAPKPGFEVSESMIKNMLNGLKSTGKKVT